MKPYSRTDVTKLNLEDNHLHPKRLVKNWWEDLSFGSNKRARQKAKKQVELILKENE